MKTKQVNTYDWIEDVGPEILKNLNELLAAKGIEPLEDLHGGSFLDNKWVGISESEDYRNYWHAYIELWGEKLHNDSYQTAWFPEVDEDDGWDYYKETLRKWSGDRTYQHTDPDWTDDLVDAVRKTAKENFPDDEQIVFWWCW